MITLLTRAVGAVVVFGLALIGAHKLTKDYKDLHRRANNNSQSRST